MMTKDLDTPSDSATSITLRPFPTISSPLLSGTSLNIYHSMALLNMVIIYESEGSKL